MSEHIGIDPGTSCGWAVLDEHGARIDSGAWDLSTKAHEGGGMRYLRARRHLCDLLDRYPRATVGYELVRRHAGTSAAHVYGGLVAHLQAVCEEREVPYAGLPVGSVKRHATGHGAASKTAMRAAASRRWGVACQTDDEADALWIADTLRSQL